MCYQDQHYSVQLCCNTISLEQHYPHYFQCLYATNISTTTKNASRFFIYSLLDTYFFSVHGFLSKWIFIFFLCIDHHKFWQDEEQVKIRSDREKIGRMNSTDQTKPWEKTKRRQDTGNQDLRLNVPFNAILLLRLVVY